MAEERYALSFDSDQECLGEVALRLLRMGIDVLYASSADEALLQASDARDQIHVVIVPPSVSPADLDRVSRRLDGPGEGKPISVVVIGERPSDEARAELRRIGAEWAVWNPNDDSALRFAVNGAMTLPSEIAPRNEPRVPTRLMASFWTGDARDDAIAYTLSAKGAFLETSTPSPVGTRLKIEIWLPSVQISTPAKVIYVNEPGESRRSAWPIGMGVVFEDLSEKHESRVRGYVEEQAQATAI